MKPYEREAASKRMGTTAFAECSSHVLVSNAYTKDHRSCISTLLLLTGCDARVCRLSCLSPLRGGRAGLRSYVAVSKVLDTHRGRCGEYSVLMMRLLEALGYTCRWVVDWSDHVWVEARVGGSWVHIDPCEVGSHAVGKTFVLRR